MQAERCDALQVLHDSHDALLLHAKSAHAFLREAQVVTLHVATEKNVLVDELAWWSSQKATTQ